jgi:GH43 family beta-xylosidase
MEFPESPAAPLSQSPDHAHPSHHALPLLSRQALAVALAGITPFVEGPDSFAAPLPQENVISESSSLPTRQAPYFCNPILPAPSADPWIFQHHGLWYSLQAVGRNLEIRATHCLSQLEGTLPVVIWCAPKGRRYSEHLWAPEMHFLDGHWFIYLAADDGRNANHRMWVLEADSPLGPWKLHGQLATKGWAIDGTVLEQDGQHYFVWSGWPGKRNGQQNLYIAKMKNPWTLASERILLTEPTEPWERAALPLCEGPQILKRDGRTFIIYSASGSWTPDYCLGMLSNEGGDPLNPRAWQKRGPVFKATEHVWGVGHCCFAQHPAGGDVIIYHAKTTKAHGWEDRNVRIQAFGWSADGFPEFGNPVDI